MADSWTFGFVGAGVMAEVMIAGLIDEGVDPGRVLASVRRAERAAELVERYGVRATLDNLEAARADLVVLCVKPQSLPRVLPELAGHLRPESVALSIIAGARIELLRRGLRHDAIVRAMPNLPCRIRAGMSVWYAPPEARPADLERVRAALRVMGQEVAVDDEGHVDRATAVNGTGPAIVAEFVKALFEAATYIGQPRPVARETVLATLMGTAQLIASSDAHVAELIDEVTSPGGTTSRALHVLRQGRFAAVVTDAVDAAYARTLALGAALEDKC